VFGGDAGLSVDRSTVGARDRDLWDCDEWGRLEVLSSPGGWIGVRVAVAWDWGDVNFAGVVAGIFWVVRTEFKLGCGLILYHQLLDRLIAKFGEDKHPTSRKSSETFKLNRYDIIKLITSSVLAIHEPRRTY
jgi:hypothetical protein